eukprot:TRINITY_DN4469_c0_g1_i1.p1 TRINITY_DN4469_c0_g1~~TRINITY_DN4469_c0_g1_i1.p1  ORF type:complete len:318 (-),score=74.52 TRINITY_DN4469_c0_g1_i1:263-1216(-)
MEEAADDIVLVEDQEGTGEFRSEMLARHQKEIKELQHKDISLKKAAAKGSKAEQKSKKKAAEEEIARLDVKLKARQAKELASLGFSGDESKDGDGLDTLVKAIAGVSTGKANQAAKPSKGQKWRERRALQEAEREQRIQEEQNNIVSERKLEEEELQRKLQPLGFGLKEIKSDGHCLYRAVEDQLALHPDVAPQHSFTALRSLAAAYMRAHPDDFVPFIVGENSDTAGESVEERLERYCVDVESTASWGGQLELGALSHSLRKHIVVYSTNLPDVVMGKEYGEGLESIIIRVSYHRHAFGLGEHYNSVVPIPAEESA